MAFRRDPRGAYGMAGTRKNLLIAGSHRSGSTYLGSVLRRSGKYWYLHEPCNRRFGMAKVRHSFPYAAIDDPTEYNPVIDELVRGIPTYKSFNISTARRERLKPYMSNIRGQLRHAAYGVFLKHLWPMLVKDPIASFAADYVWKKFDFDVIVLIRHPAAFYQSIRRRNWSFDFRNFLQQDRLMARHLSDYREMMTRDLSKVEEISLLWACIYKVLADFHAEADGAWIWLRHEDLCLDPMGEISAIMDRLDIPMSRRVEAYIRRTTGGESADARGDRLHDLVRNSEDVAYSWRGKVGRDELRRIRDITMPVAGRYYAEAEWAIE
jgi:hypothetical protein